MADRIASPRARPERPLIVCRDCGRPRPHKARGLCQPCYHNARRRERTGRCPRCGLVRPLMYVGPGGRSVCKTCHSKNQRRRPITCPGCGRETHHYTAGYCNRCYQRIRREDAHGKTVKLDRRVWRAMKQRHKGLRAAGERITFTGLVNQVLEVYLQERGCLPWRTRSGRYKRRKTNGSDTDAADVGADRGCDYGYRGEAH